MFRARKTRRNSYIYRSPLGPIPLSEKEKFWYVSVPGTRPFVTALHREDGVLLQREAQSSSTGESVPKVVQEFLQYTSLIIAFTKIKSNP